MSQPSVKSLLYPKIVQAANIPSYIYYGHYNIQTPGWSIAFQINRLNFKNSYGIKQHIQYYYVYFDAISLHAEDNNIISYIVLY